jgi:hypothetical protein
LAAEVGKARRAREKVVFVRVVHLDRVVVAELSHAVVAAIRGERRVHHERDVARVETRFGRQVDGRARDVGVADRQVVSPDRRAIGLVDRLDQRRLVDVSLAGSVRLKPGHLAVDGDSEPRTNEPAVTGQGIAEVAEPSGRVDVNEPAVSAREPAGGGASFPREEPSVAGVALVIVERVAQVHHLRGERERK